MPIFVLGATNKRVLIPAHALSVTVSGSVRDVALDVLAPPELPVVRVNPLEVLLPRLLGPASVAVRPLAGPRFDAGTVIHLAIGHDNRGDADPVVVQFDPVDVSGESGVVLATVTPRGPHVEVSVNTVADVPLSPLGTAARNAARRVAGRNGPPPGQPVVIALDCSASMRRWFANGCVGAATDVVTGVAAALGCGDVSAVLVGNDVTPVPSAPGNLADAVRRVEPRWSAGARWSRLAPGPLTVVCTDGPTAALASRFGVLALSSNPQLDAVGARMAPPPPGVDATADLLARPELLDPMTTRLIGALT